MTIGRRPVTATKSVATARSHTNGRPAATHTTAYKSSGSVATTSSLHRNGSTRIPTGSIPITSDLHPISDTTSTEPASAIRPTSTDSSAANCRRNNRQDTPQWPVAVIIVTALCGTVCVGVCSLCYYRHWRFQKTFRDEENVEERVRDLNRDRLYVTGPTDPSSDTLRLYETIADDIPPGSSSAGSNAREYVNMKSSTRQTDSVTGVTGVYMEMRLLNLSSVGEQTDEDDSRRANLIK